MIILKDGQRLNGKIQDQSIRLENAYGTIELARDVLRRIETQDDGPTVHRVHSVNNDMFIGRLLNDGFNMALNTGEQQFLKTSEMAEAVFDAYGSTCEIDTALFLTKAGGHFSGRLLNERLSINAAYGAASLQPDELNQLEFSDADAFFVKALLEDGSLIQGELSVDSLRVKPDILPEMVICPFHLKAIRFNTKRFVLKEPKEPRAKAEGESVDESLKATMEASCRRDSDQDGVLDYHDKCPTTPVCATVDGKGCWMLPVVRFDSNQFNIASGHFNSLDRVVRVLQNNPDVKLLISGHTDNRRDEAYNMALSLRRADAVKNYMSRKGIAKDRLLTEGHGFAEPVASNETAEGRAMNRRAVLAPIH